MSCSLLEGCPGQTWEVLYYGATSREYGSAEGQALGLIRTQDGTMDKGRVAAFD